MHAGHYATDTHVGTQLQQQKQISYWAHTCTTDLELDRDHAK